MGSVVWWVAVGCRSPDPSVPAPLAPPPAAVTAARPSGSETGVRASTAAPSPPTRSGPWSPAQADVLAGLAAIEEPLYECFTVTPPCTVERLAAPGSPALGALEALRAHYVELGLVVRRIPALRYVVPERVERRGSDRAAVTLCEVDGSWQIDPRGTTDPGDDVVVDDTLVSRRAVHHLVKLGGRWVRWELVELERWEGVNRCPAA